MNALVRPGLALLAALELILGSWTLLSPAGFYAEVPTVDLTPPYSEHLLRDFGGATLGLALVLAAAAVWLERRLVAVSLTAYLAFSAPHLAFHLGHLGGASGTAAVTLVAVLLGSVLLPLGLLVVALVPARRNPAADADGAHAARRSAPSPG